MGIVRHVNSRRLSSISYVPFDPFSRIMDCFVYIIRRLWIWMMINCKSCKGYGDRMPTMLSLLHCWKWKNITAWATEALPMSYGTTRRGGRPLQRSVFNTCSIRWRYFRCPTAGIFSGTLHCIRTDALLWKCYLEDIFFERSGGYIYDLY